MLLIFFFLRISNNGRTSSPVFDNNYKRIIYLLLLQVSATMSGAVKEADKKNVREAR